MIFLTVGTLYPFDRLVRIVDSAVAEGHVKEAVFAQIGDTINKPSHIEYVARLETDVYERYFCQASAVIGHAGIGTITMALRRRKPLLVVPRETQYGELVSDHGNERGVETAEAFAREGYVLMARTPDEVVAKLVELRSFVPRERHCNSKAIVTFIRQYLHSLEK